MNNIFNKEKEKWERPWNIKTFDNLYNRDERFFAIVVKGLISWLNRNIILYNEPINHFIFNTGSSYLYIESNGYEYSLNETTGEDTMYMTLPRCILELSNVNIPLEELSAPYSRGFYERQNGNMLSGYNAEIRRLPLELTVNAKYYLSNFNETIVLLQELIDKIVFQRYFTITYLGQEIQCSIEFPGDINPEVNKIDLSSPEPNQQNITLDFKIATNYPIINERSEIPTDKVIAKFYHDVDTDCLVDYSAPYEFDNLDNYGDDYNNGCTVSTLINESNVDYINKSYIENLLEKIKYDAYDEKYDENNDGKLNFKDIKEIIQKLNATNKIDAKYDSLYNKLYLTNNDTGEFEEIDMSKYKIIKDNE